MFQKFYNFFSSDIWHYKMNQLPKWKAFGIRLLRIFSITSQGFLKSQIQQGAASLTYYTLLAFVPVIALFIGIAKGFHLEKVFETWLLREFAEQEEVLSRIFTFANLSLEAANQGIIAGIGIFILLWSAIKILMNIEFVMNNIWEVREGRSFARRFSDYLALILICPIIIITASALTVYLTAVFPIDSHQESLVNTLKQYIVFLLNLIPYLLTCLLFTFLYIFMPNTRVRFIPALIAGLIAGSIYQFLQWAFFGLQVGVAQYNAIYGTFAALPLFLIWLNVSWVVLLLGAKVAFAVQNVDAFEFAMEDRRLSNRQLLIFSLRITYLCIKKFTLGEPAPSTIEISNLLEIPHPLTSQLVYQLVQAEVLSEATRVKDSEICYQPAKNPDHLTIKRVMDMINNGGKEIDLPPSRELTKIISSLEAFDHAMEHSNGNVRLKDI